MVPVKTAHHSWELDQDKNNVRKLLVDRDKEFSQVENVKTVNLTQELSMMERLVLQISVPKGKELLKMVHVLLVLSLQEQVQTPENVLPKFVLPDKFFR